MKFVAYRNIINNTDSLYVVHSIINDVTDLVTLVNNWLVDRGCDDKELLARVGKALHNVYNGKYNLSESNRNLFQVNICNNITDIRYEITFKYTTIGELKYKEVEK